jgi:hypothetical protein
LSCIRFLLTNSCAAAGTPSCQDLCIGGFSISIAGRLLWFGSQLKRIDSIQTLAAARIPVPMKFSVGTGENFGNLSLFRFLLVPRESVQRDCVKQSSVNASEKQQSRMFWLRQFGTRLVERSRMRMRVHRYRGIRRLQDGPRRVAIVLGEGAMP